MHSVRTLSANLRQLETSCASVVADALLRTETKDVGMQVATSLGPRFFYFDGSAVRIGPSIMTDAGHLPGDLGTGLPACNAKAVAGDLFRDVQIGARSADRGQLIAEVPVQGLEIAGEFDPGFAVSIQHGHAVVQVLHIRRFNVGVHQILVGWIERMVNLEIL